MAFDSAWDVPLPGVEVAKMNVYETKTLLSLLSFVTVVTMIIPSGSHKLRKSCLHNSDFARLAQAASCGVCGRNGAVPPRPPTSMASRRWDCDVASSSCSQQAAQQVRLT